MIKVYIVVCVYNMENYLKECLNSLVNQTLDNFEIIIVNDGSTDSSAKIISEYEKKYEFIKVVTQKNTGLGGARNAGMKVAKGKYIGFVDSDDFVSKEMYEKLYLKAIEEKADLVICNYKFYPNQVKNKKKWFKEFDKKLNAQFIDKNTQPWNKIVSRKLLKQIDFKFFDKNGDGAYINIFLNARKIVTLNDELYFYRVGHLSMSTTHSMDKYTKEIEIAYKQKDMLMNKPELVNELEEYFNYRIIYTYIQAITVAALLEKKNKFTKYKAELKKLNFKSNKYTSILMKQHLGNLKYYASKYILTQNYQLSRILIKLLNI